jgi:hypothetical protein
VSFEAHAIGTQGDHAPRRALVVGLCGLCASVNSVLNQFTPDLGAPASATQLAPSSHCAKTKILTNQHP